MTSQEKQELKETIKQALKAEKYDWLSIAERLIVPVLLGIATVALGINSCNKDKAELNLSEIKQKQDSVNAKRAEERDSIKSTRDFQLNLVKLYSENISSVDSTKFKNAKNLIYLMDSSFAVKILSRPWYSYIEKTGDPVYSKQGRDLVTIQKDILLRYSDIKVYYKDPVLSKAKSINSLLQINGATSNVLKPDYALSNDNQIVYYNVTQLNFCQAVQDLLRKNNFGEFKIRPSSGQSSTIDHFKIYVVQ